MTTVDRASALPLPFAMHPEFPDRVRKERYYDPDFYQMEVDVLWPRVWQMSCRLGEIPQPSNHSCPGARRFGYAPTWALRGLTALHLEFTPSESNK